ncbi:MAG TPA: adenylate kinase [Aggregatilineales bacterium]|nr:adenylate kinase [Aggregatilineales bacterium]
MGLYIIIMGVQGAGKGTQAGFIVEKYQISHISTGDLFRAMKTQDTPLAREVQEIMKAGQFVGDDLTNRIVDDRLSQDDAVGGAILDGYPRNVSQAETLDVMLRERGEAVSCVILLSLDREIAIKRAEGRRYSPDMQRAYNIYFNPPKKEGVDDETGEALIQREDDYREAVEKRIELYYDQTMPLIDYYRVRGLVKEINADQSIEAVRDDVFAVVEAAKMNR